jgi:hypothetical protein
MHEANRKYILLAAIFVFSFVFRLLLIFWDGYPPGADIGLHNSVIYSITGHGDVDFFYNFYHIGGGASLTFPGYHIFLSAIFLLTGLPEFVAHGLVVALFSSLLVLCIFLITRRVWSESAAYIVAFLAAISRFDIEMLLWAGYPNTITLLLIPLTFYLYIERERFTKLPFLASTSILIGSLFLAHSLSAGLFAAITVAAILGILVFPKQLGTTRKTALYWFLPIVIGVALVAPFVVEAVPAYFHDSSYLAGGSPNANDIGSATLSTRVLPLSIVLPLFGLIPAFMVFSKRFYNRWFTLSTFLLSVWVFVCLVFTQGYLVKFPFDYNRFLYFLILPLLVFLAVLIDYGSDFFARVIHTYRTLTQKTQPTRTSPKPSQPLPQGAIQRKLALKTQRLKENANQRLAKFSKNLTQKKLYTAFVAAFLIFSFVALPIFMSPVYNNVGESIQSFYQTMDDKGWEAILWAKNNTAGNAVFVTDALYGWWFAGFAQRPTLSAVDPQFLSLNREVDNATFARNILDTDFMIDNGYLQVREDGGFLSRHNPEFLAKIRNEYYPFPFFNFNSYNTIVELLAETNSSHEGLEAESFHVSELQVLDMYMESTRNSQSITVTHGNNLFNYTQKVTVYAGAVLANVTETLIAVSPEVMFERVHYSIDTKSSIEPIIASDNSNVGLVDIGMKTLAQLTFPSTGGLPDEISYESKSDYSPLTFTYPLNLASSVDFNFYAGTYQYNDDDVNQIDSGLKTFKDMVNTYSQQKLEEMQELPATGQEDFTIFDYQAELSSRQVAYVIVFKNPGMQPKFTLDPRYSLVFINEEAAIYRVNG